ncbi:glycosyltransferase family 4 protein [Balneatrix alpica]|uniref:Glycosyltransferase family 4 protein n=1 Tax=Balneatrix alpica TaxID=75684 RepID=A0ABV5ZE31_9GAMM|nr:glycosyltransferase family 4 protein [Balneatrix alpica]
MKIILTANNVPFIQGGAEFHVANLERSMRAHGHDVCTIKLPFHFSPYEEVERLMAYCSESKLKSFNGHAVDKVVSLQFPGYGMSHPEHIVWVMHQYRAVYELYDANQTDEKLKSLKKNIEQYDCSAFEKAKKVFANSERVAERIRQYNGFEATRLYHPPPNADTFYSAKSFNYIFCPSRLERLKRQDLLIEAARYIKSPLYIVIAGTGGQQDYYQGLIEKYDLADKVKLLGSVTEQEKIALYARAHSVFFAPFDEDYGYITLEAFYSGKPVITCTDSGGPLEFVQHQENGWVCKPDPQEIARVIDESYANRSHTEDMGLFAKEYIEKLDLNWNKVVDTLLGD